MNRSVTLLKLIISYTAWPVLVATTLTSVYYLSQTQAHPLTFMFPTSLITFMIVTFLEFRMPQRPDWGPNKKQLQIDLSHFIFTELTNQLVFRQLVVTTFAVIGHELNQTYSSNGPWVISGLSTLHPVLQIFIGLYLLDFLLYWQHRLMHEIPWLWKFHSVHHSPDGMSALNAIRNHLIGPIVTSSLTLIFSFLGMAPEVYFTILSFIIIKGWLQHANIDLKTGPLDYLFMTPHNHRWHHSTEHLPGNSNFGLITPFWDFIPWHKVPILGKFLKFKRRTFFKSSHSSLPDEVGIKGQKLDTSKSAFVIWKEQQLLPLLRRSEYRR